MAGSIKWTYYQTDDAGDWGLLRDESNVENVVVTDADADIGAASAVKYAVPKNVRPRYAVFKSTTSARTKKITIPTRALYDELAATGASVSVNRSFADADTGETFALQSLSPERLRPVVFSEDTGLDDGDAT